MMRGQQEELQQEEGTTALQDAQIQPIKVREGNDAFFPPLDLSATTKEQWQIAQGLDDYCSIIMEKLGEEKLPGNRVHERFTIIDKLLYKIVNNNPVDGDGLVKGPDSRAAQFIMANESEGAAARILKFRLALQSL